MLISKKVNVSINARNHRHYNELGYKVNNKDTIEVFTQELTKGSSVEVLLECDYCGRRFNQKYHSYHKKNTTQVNTKDACSDCRILKAKESTFMKHGVESSFSLEEVREKSRETFMERYGETHASNDPEVQEKIRRTCLERYGVENPFQCEVIQNRQKETCMDVYGVENVFANEDIQAKIKKTNMKKYGVKYPMMNPRIARKSRINSHKAMSINGSQTASSQQRHIHSLVGGELNHSFELLWLDIAYPDKGVYIEYDGSGHDIDVKYKKVSKESFQIKEIRRYKLLKSRGWKQIQIISRKDKLPSDETLVSMKDFGLNIFETTESNWIKYDIDNETISYDKNIIDFNFLDDDNDIFLLNN